MGQCYSVSVKCRVKDMDHFCGLTYRYYRDSGETPYYDGDRYRSGEPALKDNCQLTTSEGCVRGVLHGANKSDSFTVKVLEDGWVEYKSSFESSYSWEGVLWNWFSAVAPALEDGSEMYVSPDEGDWRLVVCNGKAKDVAVPDYSLDEMKECGGDWYDYAMWNMKDQLCDEVQDELGHEMDDIPDEEFVKYARKHNVRFYKDGRIASYD